MSNTAKTDRIEQLLADADDWGPNGLLGNDETHAVAATEGEREAVDQALGLQMISIRLQKNLLRDLKAIAECHGIGYQPMIRDLLNRFARSEIVSILQSRLKDAEAPAERQSSPPVEEFMRKRA